MASKRSSIFGPAKSHKKTDINEFTTAYEISDIPSETEKRLEICETDADKIKELKYINEILYEKLKHIICKYADVVGENQALKEIIRKK